ncbi:YveK family protein [Amphibacillus xylanus]|uniref:Polysaccharide biosynthesis protein n=1 Tax=Amphibacillus xylanus (strain ATCC 51415 / DSM 6626 / JCM 7361 / LMG 17667 / NBRC 15112 / Ep01) TaxID=698758 RepID=K0J5F1_AMPXN|nr:Wzz/FepE/Etk N-terminal domain-containing protein [Amphibacillus xylanus]BAM48146.1 polysaccharide biosynthesis protein [Amphibacillus xylanus NBRC 15112]
MEETITLKEIAQIIKKRLGLIIVLTIGSAIISGIFTYFFITPIYRANSQFLVNQNQPNATVELNEIRTNVELINTYSVIIRSNRILDEVIDELQLTISPSALAEKISVTNENGSQVVTVSATDPDPKMAVDLANVTVEVFQDQIDELMNVDNVNILNPAVLPANPTPVSPNLTLNIAIAFVLGGMVGVGLAFLFEYLDTTVKTETDVEKIVGLPVIGVVAKVQETDLVHIQQHANRRQARERGVTYNG